ncbi:anaerobic ribonucleoside-triphosphate reductase activating protein [Malaciobacter marinus]|uniref:Anaerobic ribonucleoside-triphosphate reductase-activating protein n=1 Tax=Malaciobacter marinus TaxID=505249 RepID=A0A347TKF5_9BACT|nr:anaerobic ribonucleoside-triphosphate reductase activating protein [Malaciobacter marinus]AXX87083.1 anaerobic ribonucleoside triphosphate reductase activating protein [Malaciobacter marinus]PHO12074.1 anaerobic ribonucleoside-triphosphate reductase activating protein [Malaciobacter marinus]PHO16295.1 anaerobic ribonucleoside-triphosphate reductase activating protein [Malaciobacter marinus]
MNINKELNLSKKIIYDITRFTTLDYKDNLSCIVWFISCNMRCQYCYNSNIVLSKEGNYEIKDLFTFLEKRVGLLDAVVLSGGEATMHNLEPICKKIKAMGFKIKLDTNGLNTKLIKTLIDEKYIDYIALDFKATKDKFEEITKTNQYNKFLDTLNFLIDKNFDFEVRTTLHEELLNENDINKIVDTLVSKGYKNSLYIQNFLNVENFANLKESKKVLNKDLLSNKLNIIWRN